MSGPFHVTEAPRKRTVLRAGFAAAQDDNLIKCRCELERSSEKLSFILGNRCSSRGIPSPRSLGISDIEENREVIYRAQQLAGKILSRKDLGSVKRFLLAPLSLWQ